jgi:UDP-glucose 4-epimerase
MNILVTGGAGYIGSHTCVELLNTGHKVIVVDNLSNSSREAIKRVEKIAKKKVKFYKVDILDEKSLDKVFNQNKIHSVMHFAGLKAVGESVEKPLEYYHNNITGTLVLCKVMKKYGVKRIIFSSSATVYGDPEKVPVKEDFPTSATNPYGRTKLFIEEILRDLYESDKDWSVVLLRYFNPIGAHKSGEIGEDPKGIPNNLLPYISQVAVGKLKKLKVYGDDYKTNDGTGVRDYIHIVDLADGHVKALKKLNNPGLYIYNLGTGRGYSVLEVIRAFEKASKKKVSYEIVERRSGDVAVNYADSTLAEKGLGWKAKYDIEKMCKDTWNWQLKNPEGYHLKGK